MSEHDHGDHHRSAELGEVGAEPRALEQLLVEKGVVDPAFIDDMVEAYANDIGPMNQARVVARAWATGVPRPLARGRHRGDRRVGLRRPRGKHRRRGEHRRRAQRGGVHAVLVLSVASARAAADVVQEPRYRSRMVREPRQLLAEMGCDLPEHTEVRVCDSSAELRYMVLPQRPQGTESLGEEQLAELVVAAR